MIDGLTKAVLEAQLQKDRLPNLKKFFLSDGQTVHAAHTVFPSVTFTNISSLLREAPVHETGAFGNKFIVEKNFLDFESLNDRPKFSEHMRGRNIFTRLTEKDMKSVSLDYGLGVDATVFSEFDFQSGYSASQLDYRYLDRKKIDALKLLLTNSTPPRWPEFIFVHLVGLDFLSHRSGPLSTAATDYLKQIDRDLAPIFEVLKKTEKLHPTVSLLTSDHGFNLIKAKYFLNIEKSVRKVIPSAVVINESRFASLYFFLPTDEIRLQRLSSELLGQFQIETVAYKKNGYVILMNRQGMLKLKYGQNDICPPNFVSVEIMSGSIYCNHQLPQNLQHVWGRYLTENLISYFKNERSPDMVVLSRFDSTFSKSSVGQHGGATDDETMTPLLVRGANFKMTERTPAIWELLKFIGH